MERKAKYAAAPVFRNCRVLDLASLCRWLSLAVSRCLSLASDAGTTVTLPYLAAAFGVLSFLPGSSGAAALTTSSANFRWLVSSFSAKS